jgi:hypothetical protein
MNNINDLLPRKINTLKLRIFFIFNFLHVSSISTFRPPNFDPPHHFSTPRSLAELTLLLTRHRSSGVHIKWNMRKVPRLTKVVLNIILFTPDVVPAERPIATVDAELAGGSAACVASVKCQSCHLSMKPKLERKMKRGSD